MRGRIVLFTVIGVTALTTVARADDGPDSSDSAAAACVAIREQAEVTLKEGKLVAAREQLDRCAQPSCTEDTRQACTRRRDAIDAMIPTVVFGVRDALGRDVDAVVTIDGSSVPVPLGRMTILDPGIHEVEWSSKPNEPSFQGHQKLTIFEGERGRIVLLGPSVATDYLHHAPNRSSGLRPSCPWIVVGAGAFLVTTATVFQLIALREDSDRKTLNLTLGRTDLSTTERDLYERSRTSHHDAAETDQAIAITVGSIGIAAIVGGITWALLSPRRGDHHRPLPITRGLR